MKKEKKASYIIEKGSSFPLGATLNKHGINFSIFSDTAKEVSLCLFSPDTLSLIETVPLDPTNNRTGYIWHIFIKDLPEDFAYGYVVDGKLLHDPYAKAITTGSTWGKKSDKILGHLVFDAPFDWENDTFPNIPLKNLIIYEMHPRAFTQDSSVKHPGTFLGVIEKIPHLKKLGVNAIELLPIFEFDECENKNINPISKERLYNFWGYSTINFFAPMHRYATSAKKHAAILECKTMIKELHKAGIEVILDVVFNHTAEGNENGPFYSFKGLGKKAYYHIDEKGEYKNFSGCGNSMNCNHPVTAKLILDSLRYWVDEMHVDGFRFDLASILTRDQMGNPSADPFLIQAITEDPVLAHTKLIAEAWDAGGLYQVGSFPHYERWAEWNGKYRDSVRRFIKGTDGTVGDFCQAICGSEELYGKSRQPCHSINFITCHDGFTLYDLVAYQDKHNLANAENNQDGSNDNQNWNCGAEGPTDNPEIIELRERQMRNFLLALMISIGTPMINMGDEYQHSRLGNNNAWCQDNHLNWFLWNKLEDQKDFFVFLQNLTNFRKKTSFFQRDTFLSPQDITWHGHKPEKPDWSPKNRFVAYSLHETKGHHDLYIVFNADYKDAKVLLPTPGPKKQWHCIIDTSKKPYFMEKPSPLPAMELVIPPYSAYVAQAP